ncbi:hypothetical protein KCP70_05930 [Salmonella enterica subsp. enterica]|nr:hypothetical protein KCP70_05930 [Salmonella enterica subsp. enterica]
MTIKMGDGLFAGAGNTPAIRIKCSISTYPGVNTMRSMPERYSKVYSAGAGNTGGYLLRGRGCTVYLAGAGNTATRNSPPDPPPVGPSARGTLTASCYWPGSSRAYLAGGEHLH